MPQLRAALIDAIENRLQVCFRYKGTDDPEATLRIVEPWIYGLKNGKESLYGYQLEGGEEGIRRFDLRRVKNVELTGAPCEHHPATADMTKWDTVYAQHLPKIAA